MTTAALIDLHLTHSEEVGPTDGENAVLRARTLARAQELIDKIYPFAEWDFKLSYAQIPMTTTGFADLPADFADFGDNGGVYIDTQRWKLRWLEPRELYRRKEMYASTSSNPDYFTVNDYAMNGTRQIHLFPLPSGDLTLNIYYNVCAPTLVDATDETNLLQALPTDFHRPVMLKGLQWLSAIDKGDGRVSEFDAWFERELGRMKARHVFGREDNQALGQYGGIPAYRSW